MTIKNYVGLDVSMQETFITIINSSGEIVAEGSVITEVADIVNFLQSFDLEYERIGIESGQFSIYLCKGLRSFGLNAICVDARHMSRLLSADKVNKNDRNDAFGIANMMRVNLYKEVKVKSDASCSIKILLGGRRKIVETRQEIMGTIRGLLKMEGIKLDCGISFTKEENMDLILSNLSDQLSKNTITALIESLKQIEKTLKELTDKCEEVSKSDEDCKLLTTIPGVGTITALTNFAKPPALLVRKYKCFTSILI